VTDSSGRTQIGLGLRINIIQFIDKITGKSIREILEELIIADQVDVGLQGGTDLQRLKMLGPERPALFIGIFVVLGLIIDQLITDKRGSNIA